MIAPKTSGLGGWIIKDRGNASQVGHPILNRNSCVIIFTQCKAIKTHLHLVSSALF